MPVYDSNVFDTTTYDTLFGVPTLLKVQVEPEYHKILAGQVVIINCYIINTLRPNHRQLFNPSGGVYITLYNPDKSIKVHNAAMLNMETGIYQYRHQTGLAFDIIGFDLQGFDVPALDVIGVYTASFAAREGPSVMATVPQEVYEVVDSFGDTTIPSLPGDSGGDGGTGGGLHTPVFDSNVFDFNTVDVL